MGTSPTTEVHGYHRCAVLGLDNAFVFDHHAGTVFGFSLQFFVSTSVASPSLILPCLVHSIEVFFFILME